MFAQLKKISILLPVALGACVSMPDGPSQMAMPGTGKTFDQFRADDASCRRFALSQVGGTSANQAGNSSMAGTAAVGTVLGAAVGAVAGGGRGAGIGAATGLLAGSLIGADESQVSSYGTQRRYDQAYMQCMYASGERVPVSGRFMNQQVQPSYAPAAGTGYPPPPPPGAYPPPPPSGAYPPPPPSGAYPSPPGGNPPPPPPGY